MIEPDFKPSGLVDELNSLRSLIQEVRMLLEQAQNRCQSDPVYRFDVDRLSKTLYFLKRHESCLHEASRFNYPGGL